MVGSEARPGTRDRIRIGAARCPRARPAPQAKQGIARVHDRRAREQRPLSGVLEARQRVGRQARRSTERSTVVLGEDRRPAWIRGGEAPGKVRLAGVPHPRRRWPRRRCEDRVGNVGERGRVGEKVAVAAWAPAVAGAAISGRRLRRRHMCRVCGVLRFPGDGRGLVVPMVRGLRPEHL